MNHPNRQSHTARIQHRSIAAISTLLVLAGQAHAQQVDINAWKQSNEYRAMALQREIAADMPQSQSLMLGSHNSYNSSAYNQGYVLYQHSYTLSQQLDLGLRSLDLDVHALPLNAGELFVTHSSCTGVGYVVGDLTLAEALVEIKFWMDQNPNEVIILCIEPHFPMPYPSLQHTRFEVYCEAFFGNASGNDRIIRPSEIAPATSFGNHESWEQQLITFTDTSLNQLRQHGRVMFINIGGSDAGCDDDSRYWPNYPAGANIIFGNAPSFSWCNRPNWDFIPAHDFITGSPLLYFGSTCVGAALRDCNTDRSPYSFLYNNTSDGQFADYGSEPPSTFREAVRAGVDVVRLDPVGRSHARPGHTDIEYPADEQMRATIWSWDYRYVPPIDNTPRAGMAVIDGDTARIRFESPAADMRYALQDVNGNWSISGERGTFTSAPATFASGGNFRVPGNGFEMQNLFGAMVRAGITRVWINYHDLDGNGAWTASTQKREFGAEAEISPYPILISNQSALNLSQNTLITPQRPTGLVFSIYPSSYPSPTVLNNPGTFVPWAPGVPTEIGR